MLMFLIYLADLSERASSALTLIIMLSLILWLGGRFLAALSKNENELAHLCVELFEKTSKLAGIIFAISMVVYGVTPKKEAVWLMTAAYVGQQPIDTPEMQKARSIIIRKLDDLDGG